MSLEDFVGDTDLTVGWQLEDQLDNGGCDPRIYAMVEQRPVMGNLLQRSLTTLIAQFLKSVKTIARATGTASW